MTSFKKVKREIILKNYIYLHIHIYNTYIENMELHAVVQAGNNCNVRLA